MRRVCEVLCIAGILGSCSVEPSQSSSTTQAIQGMGAHDPTVGWADAGSLSSVGGSSVTWMGMWNVALCLPAGSAVPPILATFGDNGSVVTMSLVSSTGELIAQTGPLANGLLTPSHTVLTGETFTLKFSTPWGSSAILSSVWVGVGSCQLNVNYTSPTTSNFAVSSNVECGGTTGYTGRLVASNDGENINTLDPNFPVCGTNHAIGTAIPSGNASATTFTLAVRYLGDTLISCSAVLPAR